MVSGGERPRRRRRQFVFDSIGELAVANLAERTEQPEGVVIVRALRVYQALLREYESGCRRLRFDRTVELGLRLPFVGRVASLCFGRLDEVDLDEWLFAAREEGASS